MSTINTIDIYEARSPVDQKELLRLIDDELVNPEFPSDNVAVHAMSTDSIVTVISITPKGVDWTWTPKLKAFTANKGKFTLRKKSLT